MPRQEGLVSELDENVSQIAINLLTKQHLDQRDDDERNSSPTTLQSPHPACERVLIKLYGLCRRRWKEEKGLLPCFNDA